jgi:protein O-GlcNAc transferase
MNVPASDQGQPIEEIFRRGAEESARRAREEHERMLRRALAALEDNDRDPGAYITAARAAKRLGTLSETLAILERGIARCAPSAALYEYFIERLEKCNRTEEAITAARAAMRLFPDDLSLTLWEATLLPILYDTPSQIDRCRERFAEGLRKFCDELRLDTARERARALEAIGKRVTLKYLTYQGRNDRELQELYGGLVHGIMAANYAEWARPVPVPPIRGKIRVGYLWARLTNMSAAKLFGGWLHEQNRQQFEIFAYHGGRDQDLITAQVRQSDLSFRQCSGGLEEIAQAVLADRLHVLVYLDFGMHPIMAQLAGLRLAPVQCVAWDTPVTSGLPTMDYFLSSALMEPADGQEHYSEKLVALPGVGVCYTKPVIPSAFLTRTRQDFGLRDDAAVYLSCQSIFKYRPDHDAVFARIAQRVPNSQFVFLVTNDVVGSDFRRRLNRAFATAGLRADDHCVWLPEMPTLDYWNLHLIADVFLDAMGWSGGVTTFEAIACRLPIVTLPGTLMRARHSHAILTQLGVTETIARDEADYVDLAVRLRLDRMWHQSVVDRMVAGYPQLYSDTRSVRALEEFFRSSLV